MKNKFLVAVPFFLVFIISVITYACSCNCGKNTDEANTVKGYITVVGNEPFTKLAIKTLDDKIYILQCSKEMHQDLWKQQGSLYYILYADLRKDQGDTTIVVEKVIPLTKDDK